MPAWPNVDLERQWVRVVEFVSTLGHDLVPSMGKSHDAIRTIELDAGLVGVLRRQQAAPGTKKAVAATQYESSDYVFTK